MDRNSLDQLCINVIRRLSMDAVQKAKSGHPGMPMGMAPAAYALWAKFLKHNPRNPKWVNRDRFIAEKYLATSGIFASVINMPSWEIFERQPQEYRDSVLPPSIRARGAAEAGVKQGWERYIGDHGAVVSAAREVHANVTRA